MVYLLLRFDRSSFCFGPAPLLGVQSAGALGTDFRNEEKQVVSSLCLFFVVVVVDQHKESSEMPIHTIIFLSNWPKLCHIAMPKAVGDGDRLILSEASSSPCPRRHVTAGTGGTKDGVGVGQDCACGSVGSRSWKLWN